MMNILRRLLCLLGFHDFQVVEVTVGFGPSGAVEKVDYGDSIFNYLDYADYGDSIFNYLRRWPI